MKAEIVRFPIGQYQGMPALRCEISHDDALGHDLVDEMRGRLDSGVHLVWLVTDLWGMDQLDVFLVRLIGDRQFSELPIVAMRGCLEQSWSNIGIGWIVDITSVFRHEMNGIQMRRAAIRAAQVPRPMELVWREPPAENLTIDGLEAISESFGACGWIYSESDELRSVAFRTACRSAAVWGVREGDPSA